METTKQKLHNQITSYLISFKYFVHPPGVASTAGHGVLIDKMYRYEYTEHCGMAAYM